MTISAGGRAVTRRPKTTPGSAIGVIVKRAERIARQHGIAFPSDRAARLIALVHERHPIRLTDLAKAERDEDLAHDVFGILRNANRKTGELLHGFSPRYSRPTP
jgi:hypothetical protein